MSLYFIFFSTIGVSLGTLVAFQVVIGDLAPAVVTGTFGFEVRYHYDNVEERVGIRFHGTFWKHLT